MVLACYELENPAKLNNDYLLEGPVVSKSLENLKINQHLTNFRPAEEQKKP